MKKLFALSVLCFVLVACDQSTLDERMIGLWSDTNESAEGERVGTLYIFHEDGSLALHTLPISSVVPEGGSWRINSKGHLCMTFDDDGDEECATFEFTNERTMTLTDSANGTVTTLRRWQTVPAVSIPRDTNDP